MTCDYCVELEEKGVDGPCELCWQEQRAGRIEAYLRSSPSARTGSIAWTLWVDEGHPPWRYDRRPPEGTALRYEWENFKEDVRRLLRTLRAAGRLTSSRDLLSNKWNLPQRPTRAITGVPR